MKYEQTIESLEGWMHSEERQLGFDHQELEKAQHRQEILRRSIERREQTISDLRGAIAVLRGEEEA